MSNIEKKLKYLNTVFKNVLIIYSLTYVISIFLDYTNNRIIANIFK